jgi:anaerobic selenocysteine-containing dehydrogenase
MCHEATSVGLPESIGMGKGTVTLDDFAHCDALFSFGHNPGTNHPRMLSTLREISKRGVPIVAVNPLRERGLERFTSPQHPAEMLTNTATPIAQTYYQVRIGGDLALLKGMMKCLLDADAEDLAASSPNTPKGWMPCARTWRAQRGTRSSNVPGCRAMTSPPPRDSMPRQSA